MYSKKLAVYERRNKEIIKMRGKGATFTEIAAKYGISRQRVAIICKKGEK